jgi:hypothetical protein
LLRLLRSVIIPFFHHSVIPIFLLCLLNGDH